MISRVLKNSTLARLIAYFVTENPKYKDLALANSEAAFIQAAEAGMEKAIRMIEGRAKDYTRLLEPGLSGLFVDLLRAADFAATAETGHNGHVDVIIEETPGGRWKYLGECKIYGGLVRHVSGCQQLLGYCSGREMRAFRLDFFKQDLMYEKLADLRQQFDKDQPAAQDGLSSGHTIEGAFITKHAHPNGRNIEILHLGCAVWVAKKSLKPKEKLPKKTKASAL